jgi:hypothetical protein
MHWAFFVSVELQLLEQMPKQIQSSKIGFCK